MERRHVASEQPSPQQQQQDLSCPQHRPQRPSTSFSQHPQRITAVETTATATEKPDPDSPLKKRRCRKVGAKCRVAGCTSRPWFAAPGAKVPRACKNHKSDDEMNIYTPACEADGCTTRPHYGEEGKRARFCCVHKLDGMVDVLNKKCIAKGCRKQPSWAEVRGIRPVFCKEHKHDGMVDTKHKTCAHPGCTRLPSKSPPPAVTVAASSPKSDRNCSGLGAENKASNRPQQPQRQPPPIFCAAHAPKGSTNVTAPRCREPGCDVQPSFGREGAGEPPAFCVRHRKRDMTDVRNPRCRADGCVAQPRCSWEGDSRPTFCLRHADPDMVNVRLGYYREAAPRKKQKALVSSSAEG